MLSWMIQNIILGSRTKWHVPSRWNHNSQFVLFISRDVYILESHWFYITTGIISRYWNLAICENLFHDLQHNVDPFLLEFIQKNVYLCKQVNSIIGLYGVAHIQDWENLNQISLLKDIQRSQGDRRPQFS